MRYFVFYICLLLTVTRAAEEEKKEKVWPECPTASADKTSSAPNCDPCSPKVYTLYKNEANTQLYQSYSSAIRNYDLKGWIRFGSGTGRVTENCPLQYTCGSTYPVWLNGVHPEVDEGIVPSEMCAHYTNGNCCTYKEDVHVKNCGNYFVYRLTYNKPISGNYWSYCVEPKEQPNICEDTKFVLKEDNFKRGELHVGTSTSNDPINIGNDNNWYTFLAGKGTIKRNCPGINHCGFKFPMWIDGEYPTKEGEIVHRMGHAATSTSNICAITNSKPVYIVKCGDKFYHKFDQVVTYSGFCVDEEFDDLCTQAVPLEESWRGTTVDKARDHCDTNGLTDFEDWYRIGAYEKKLPDRCVAPNKCGADNGYFVQGGHPDVGEGIVGRNFYYSTDASCVQGGIAGYILNCGDKDSNDYIYKFSKPSGCDKVFCAEQDPCSSTVYQKLDEHGRSGRTFSKDKINDATLKHGWYRFTKGEGIMSRSPVLPGHSGVTYPGWYDGEYPLEEDDEKTGRACFTYNGNNCYQEREVTVRNCKDFFVYHLRTTAANYGYTYEEDVCAMDVMKLDDEYRLQYNLDAIAIGDDKLQAGWYEITLGNRRLTTDQALYKHGGTGKHPGWMEGEHPSTDEGIVERTVYFTTTNTNPKGSSTKVYVINCGARFLYYFRPVSAAYFYSISQDLCQKGSYTEVDQDYRLYSNPSELANLQNSDNKFFVTYTNWYRFMNGNGRAAESPKINNFYMGGFQYPYQFPEGSHAAVPADTISEEILMEHYRGVGNEHYTSWPWRIQIANCGNYFLYKIPPLSSSYSRAGLVVDDDPDDVCSAERYKETDDKARLISSTNVNTGTSDYYLSEGWYRLTAGLGYMPSVKFIGTQCSTTYHGHLNAPHPTGDDIVENQVNFYSTNPASISSKRRIWVKRCEGFYVYRLRESPGTTYRYCEATDGCEHARELENQWRVTGKKMTSSAKYESATFGNDGWVYFSTGLKRLPEAPPPKDVAGCAYNGYIDSHPAVSEGAVPRIMRFPGTDKTEPIQVQNCGERYVYFLSRSITNNYCYAADVDVCDEDVYTQVTDERRLHYSHKYGTGFTRFDLDNKFNGWVRYMVGKGRLMEEAPALTGMCMTEYQGWINGVHPTEKEGTVKREVCWKYGGEDCKTSNDISIKNCGDYFVYGISKPPPNNQYGHCVEQDKTEVCEGAKKLDDFRRGMLTPTTEYVNDQLNVVADGYYRFMSGLGRLTAFPVKVENCGGIYRMLIKAVREKDEKKGDALYDLQTMKAASWSGTVYRNIGLQCDGYWVYQLFHVNTAQLTYCVEEEVCDSLEIKRLYSKLNQQWLKEVKGNEFQDLTTGWYQAMVGERRLSHAPPDTGDCGAVYPGYVTTAAPSRTDGIVPGKVCYRTNDNSAPTSSCQQIYMKSCSDKTLYYLTKSPSAQYAMCIETDVCQEVEGTPLDETWRLTGTPRAANGFDKFAIGWYRVSIGEARLAVNAEEANCGSTYPGYMMLGRHPAISEGTVNTEVCYNTGGATPANCKAAQVVNCGTHYLYHLRPGSTNYGVCVASDERSMCTNYKELGDPWRSVEYSASIDKEDKILPSDWYRFTTGLGRLPRTCPSYKHGGGHYPAWSDEIDEIPAEEMGVQEFTIYWRYVTGNNYCKYWSKKAYVRNCGEYHVYFFPTQTTAHTTYTTEADVCNADQYEVIDDEHRLAWRPTTDQKTDVTLTSGWYRFDAGLKKINEECIPPSYGGTLYPGWMEGGHPDVGDVEDRTVYFRTGTNCKQSSKIIKVKNCGSFFLYRLPPTANNYGYTIGSEPCDIDPRTLGEEDRNIYERSTSHLNDNGLAEGWYQFTTGFGVIAKSPPFPKSCRSAYPVWMDGEDPSPEEGVVTRTMCAVNGGTVCQWPKEGRVRNCGNNKMMYYFSKASLPYSTSRYCVDNSMQSVCDAAKPINDEWRGSSKRGTGHKDKDLVEGWYKFTKFNKRIANFPVTTSMCGSTYPIWMGGDHVEKGSCKSQTFYQVNSRTNLHWRSGTMQECQCNNGEYIYYHVPGDEPTANYEGAYCVEEEPCNTQERYTGNNRSPWFHTNINQGDESRDPRWVRLAAGLGVMPTYTPETYSCGSTYPAWYDGDMPAEVGDIVRGQYCFVTSATALCSSPREARVKKCATGYVYHVLPTASASYGYCVDEDVCDVASEEWGQEEAHRLRYTSISGYYSGTRRYDNSLGDKFWFKITIGTQRLPDECVSYMSCGTLYPGWLQGEHPTPEERIVDRQICFTQGENCCAKTQNAKVVSCNRNGKQYYLYRLYKTASNYGYCVDESGDAVCKISTNNIMHITDPRHGTGVYKDSSFKADYQQYTTPGWFTVSVHEKQFIHYPPTMYFCGTTYAGWIEAAAPGPNEGVVTTRACYRESQSNEDCYSPMPFKMKNCDGKMRYLYAPVGKTTRNMCVEQDLCKAGNYKVFKDETWRMAYTKTEGTDYRRDYRRIETAPYRGWIRFTGVGKNRLTTIQQEYASCGTQYPAWMEGEHPTADEGVTPRTLYVTYSNSNYKWINQPIYVKNCGDFMIYNVDFNWQTSYKWGLCVETDVCKAPVAELHQSHRLVNTWGLLKSSGDNGLTRGWYKFTNGFEKMPESCPIADSCGSRNPGYLSHPHPALSEGIVERKVCFGDADQCCVASTDVLVRNCGTHFVYRLYPTSSTQKYCVEENPDSMCSESSYKVLDNERRGENVPYDANRKFSDQLLEHGWYRFTTDLGRMPEYSMASQSCGMYYPGYLSGGAHPNRQQGVVNRQVCFSTSLTNEGQSCKNIRVKNCGKYYVYELVPTPSYNYGYCVAQDQCLKANELAQRWRLVINPSITAQSKAADNTLRKGWYRLAEGHGTFPDYEPDNYYGGSTYPSYMLGDLPTVKEGDVKRTLRYPGVTTQTTIRAKNCGEHYVFWLPPSPAATYTYSIDTDVCLHARKLGEYWRNMFNVPESLDELQTDYQMGKDWYQFTTGFKMMAEKPPEEQYSCGTKYAAYLNQDHPTVEDGVTPKEVCFKNDESDDIYQACIAYEQIKVKNCGDYYAYLLNPQVKEGAYCVYNRKSSCEPQVVHAKYGEKAVINCTLNSEKDFDSSEVVWTKLYDSTLPDNSLKNMALSDDRLLVNINDIADQNAGVYSMYIPSTETSELVEVVLYNAVETAQKYYVVEAGKDVDIEVTINVDPAPLPGKISWKKLPNKELKSDKYQLSHDHTRLSIKGVSAAEAGTYRCTALFTIDGVDFSKHSDVIVQLPEEEED